MNIPIPTWSVYIVVQGKIVKVGNHTNISPPTENTVKKIALDEGYSSFTDFRIVEIDDGRDS